MVIIVVASKKKAPVLTRLSPCTEEKDTHPRPR